MIKTSINLDAQLHEAILQFGKQKGIKGISVIIRQLIKSGMQYESLLENTGQSQPLGKQSLMVAERAAIQASIESLLLLRKIVNKPEVIEEVKKQAYDIIEQRWNY